MTRLATLLTVINVMVAWMLVVREPCPKSRACISAPVPSPVTPVESFAYATLFRGYAEREYARLQAASSINPALPFDHIKPTMPIAYPLKTRTSDLQFMKSYISDVLIPGTCVVYGFGLASTVEWELHMAKTHGCEVHGFDCTSNLEDLARAAAGKVSLHPWCVGKERAFENNYYSKHAHNALTFFSLREIMHKLGHRKVDVLKFDIEGFEWELFHSEILPPQVPKPNQLLFELHTQGANPQYVPRGVVQGKTGAQVDQLVLQLFQLGYRIFDIDINPGDKYCAEFGMLRV